jgi:hypothetical protein
MIGNRRAVADLRNFGRDSTRKTAAGQKENIHPIGAHRAAGIVDHLGERRQRSESVSSPSRLVWAERRSLKRFVRLA